MSAFDPTNVPKPALDEILRLEKRCERLERDLVRAREKKRFEAAKAAMGNIVDRAHRDYFSSGGNVATMSESVLNGFADCAVRAADALLARLSESKETEGV
jgi:hypothetical protein